MTRLPALTGWRWLKEGFALFRKQPVQLSTLFIFYLFLILMLGIIPWLGQVLPLILLPTVSLAFLRASALVREGQPVRPTLLFAALRTPAARPLLLLGVLQLLAITLAFALPALLDDGVFFKFLSGQIGPDSKLLPGSHMGLAMLGGIALYLPAQMALWYAAPLVAWHGMGIGKALFYSFFAVRREGRAFVVYLMSWLAIGILLPALLTLPLLALFHSPVLIVTLMMPVSLLLTVVLYSSFYITYTDVFGAPAQPTIDIAV